MRLTVLITAALLASAMLASAPAAAQDIATGQILFNQRCSFCHSLTRQSRQTTIVPLQRPTPPLAVQAQRLRRAFDEAQALFSIEDRERIRPAEPGCVAA